MSTISFLTFGLFRTHTEILKRVTDVDLMNQLHLAICSRSLSVKSIRYWHNSPFFVLDVKTLDCTIFWVATERNIWPSAWKQQQADS